MLDFLGGNYQKIWGFSPPSPPKICAYDTIAYSIIVENYNIGTNCISILYYINML